MSNCNRMFQHSTILSNVWNNKFNKFQESYLESMKEFQERHPTRAEWPAMLLNFFCASTSHNYQFQQGFSIPVACIASGILVLGVLLFCATTQLVHSPFSWFRLISFTGTWTPNWPPPNISGFIAWLVRASHRYRKVTGLSPQVLNFFRLLNMQLHKLRSQRRGSFFISF